jgi:hypothetical protein
MVAKVADLSQKVASRRGYLASSGRKTGEEYRATTIILVDISAQA